MNIAIMQPYFFPYLGYFQLIDSVDYFVIFDDVNYIKRGWINKNRILTEGEIHNFTIPVQKASQNRKINQHFRTLDTKELSKLKKKIQFSYTNAPNFENVYPLIEQIIDHPETNLARYLGNSLSQLATFIGIDTKFVYASEMSCHDDWDSAEQRIIDITKQLGGTQYINLPGGKDLYDTVKFRQNNISLKFINVKLPIYQQYKSKVFEKGLSIIDVLMNVSKKDIALAMSITI